MFPFEYDMFLLEGDMFKFRMTCFRWNMICFYSEITCLRLKQHVPLKNDIFPFERICFCLKWDSGVACDSNFYSCITRYPRRRHRIDLLNHGADKFQLVFLLGFRPHRATTSIWTTVITSHFGSSISIFCEVKRQVLA